MFTVGKLSVKSNKDQALLVVFSRELAGRPNNDNSLEMGL